MAKNDSSAYRQDLFGNRPLVQLEFDFNVPRKNNPVLYIAEAPQQILEDLRQLPWQKQIRNLQNMHYGAFETLFKSLLQEIGLVPVPVTKEANKGDGGIDIICRPQNCSIPFYTMVSIKQRSSKNISRNHVDEVSGIILREPYISTGMIITNTDFAPSAKLAADASPFLIQLRAKQDILRWLKGDYSKEYEWADIPDEIELFGGKHRFPKSLFTPVEIKIA